MSSRGPAEQRQPESGPSIGPPQMPSANMAAARPTIPIPPRYEEEEEDEEEDVYAPELPPDLAAARANPSALPRRAIPIGPARGPLRREEEEEESEDEEIGPAPPPGAGPSHVHEDAVIEF